MRGARTPFCCASGAKTVRSALASCVALWPSFTRMRRGSGSSATCSPSSCFTIDSILRWFWRLALTMTVLVMGSATALTQLSFLTRYEGAWRIGRPSGPTGIACCRSCASPLKAVLIAVATLDACAWRIG